MASADNGFRKPIYKPSAIAKRAKSLGLASNQICCMCLKVITVQIFKNAGVCSENCRKDRDNDHQPFRGGALSP